MGVKRGAYRVLVGKPEGKKNHMKEPGIYGRIILRWIFRKWDVGIDMAQVRDRGRALVYMVMNLRVP
jgi:hypothetical protein